MTGCIRAIDHALVVNHVCFREEVLGSNPTTSEFLLNVFAQFLKYLRNVPRLGHRTWCFTLFYKGPAVCNVSMN